MNRLRINNDLNPIRVNFLPELSSQDDVARMAPAFVRHLAKEFDLAALTGRLCPVLLADGTVTLFALVDYAQGDQIEEVERLVRKRGYVQAQVPRYVLPGSLLLTITRDQLTADALRNGQALPQTKQASALMSVFMDIVRWGVRESASDIHININQCETRSDLYYTVGGAYISPACFQGMSSATLLEVLAVAWMEVRGGNGAVFDPLIEQQGRVALTVDDASIVLRWASLATDNGPSVCLRILRVDSGYVTSSLQALGYLPTQIQQLEQARDRQGGAIVLAGVVGSGKSTTIATLMRGVPLTRKLITLEDPVEYVIGNALQNTVGRALNDSEEAIFDAKLKTIKRSAMNDLLIGEVRDAATGKAFMDLAGSGVSVYTTTHTGSALMIPERLASDFIGVSRDFLATPGVLKLLVYQVLLPCLCPSCSLPFNSFWEDPESAHHDSANAQWARHWNDWLQFERGVGVAGLRRRNPAGCPACKREQLPELRGTKGRTVAAEIIAPDSDEKMLELIRLRDNLGLQRYIDAQPRTALNDPDMRGKRARDCALYKALKGEVDLRDVEHSLGRPAAAPAKHHGISGDHHV